MLKIGDFSLLSKISIHMLRHYDEIGLLKPIHVDDFTNYRYYDEKQLSVANRIQSLKGMGLSLSTIEPNRTCCAIAFLIFSLHRCHGALFLLQ